MTRKGEGIKSRPVYCRTLEDVPSPPENIKAVPLSTSSILGKVAAKIFFLSDNEEIY